MNSKKILKLSMAFSVAMFTVAMLSFKECPCKQPDPAYVINQKLEDDFMTTREILELAVGHREKQGEICDQFYTVDRYTNIHTLNCYKND